MVEIRNSKCVIVRPSVTVQAALPASMWTYLLTYLHRGIRLTAACTVLACTCFTCAADVYAGRMSASTPQAGCYTSCGPHGVARGNLARHAWVCKSHRGAPFAKQRLKRFLASDGFHVQARAAPSRLCVAVHRDPPRVCRSATSAATRRASPPCGMTSDISDAAVRDAAAAQSGRRTPPPSCRPRAATESRRRYSL